MTGEPGTDGPRRGSATRLLVVLAGVVVLCLVALGASAVLDRPARSTSSTQTVAASQERVWEVVTDFGRYSEWNPYLTRIEGTAAADATLEVRLSGPEGSAEDIEATVVVFRPPRKLAWRSRLAAPGLRDVEYQVIVTEAGPERALVEQRLRHEGLLAPFVDGEAVEAGLARMTRALAERAETGT